MRQVRPRRRLSSDSPILRASCSAVASRAQSMTHLNSNPPAAGGSPANGLVIVLTTASIVVPMTLAYNVPPSSTFLNQATALIGWAGVLLVWARHVPLPAI